MRVASVALLALLAGAYAANIQTKVDIKTLKKSEHNSDTFFADFDLWVFIPNPPAPAVCTGNELNGELYVTNAVGGTQGLNFVSSGDDPLVNTFIPSGFNCFARYNFAGELYSHVDFNNFPFDFQEHEIVIANNAYAADYELVLGSQNFGKHDYHVDGWRDIAFHTESSIKKSAVTGGEIQLFSFKKTIRREFTYYLSKYISNVILLVIMSAFTAFLPVNDSIRIVLSLLIFVAIIIWQTAISHKLPSVAFPNKYDQFIHVSFAFVFAQFLYYTVHKALYKESNVELKTLGEDAAEPATGMTTAKKVDTVVHVVFGLVYFIAVASVLGVGTDLDFFD